jgi:hypothetical protein
MPTMRNKPVPVFSALLLVLGWGVAHAAEGQNAARFTLLLTDGSQVNGAVSFVINLDTACGKIQIPSGNLVSVRFDAEQKWADIRLTDAQMKLKYDPACGDLKATTSAGPLTIALSNVSSVARASAEVSGGISPNAAQSRSAAASRGGVPPPAVKYAPQQPHAAPPTVVYRYPYQYPYAPPTTYYSYSPYCCSPRYWPGPYVGWPYLGIGIGVGPRFFGGFLLGFALRIR